MGRLRVYMFHHVSCVFFSPWYPLIINRCLGFAASRRWKWPGQLLTLPTGLNTWKRQIGCWDLNPPFGSIWEWSERITYILGAWWQATRLATEGSEQHIPGWMLRGYVFWACFRSSGCSNLLRKPAGRLGVVSPCERSENKEGVWGRGVVDTGAFFGRNRRCLGWRFWVSGSRLYH